MSGDVGRLNVYVVGQDEVTSLLWRLTGNQGNHWNTAQLRVNAVEGFKVARVVKTMSLLLLFCYYYSLK